MKPSKRGLTPHELEIMNVIWRLERATVRDVYEALLRERKIAYTTVMTMMKILTDKGFLKKNRDERAFLYTPSKPRGRVVGAMVQDFLDRVFDGAAKPLLVHLIEERKLSRKELGELRELIGKERGER